MTNRILWWEWMLFGIAFLAPLLIWFLMVGVMTKAPPVEALAYIFPPTFVAFGGIIATEFVTDRIHDWKGIEPYST